MLSEFHRTLETLFYQHARVDPRDVDVRFEAPTKEWTNGLTRPTVDFFLFDLEENVELRQMDFMTQKSNGKAIRTPVARRIKLQYMVSALASEVDDEHALLWRTLAALMRVPEVPEAMLPESVGVLQAPITTKVNQPDEDRRLLQLWSALGSPPRPALHYVVTVPLDLELAIEAPLVLTRGTTFRQVEGDEDSSTLQIGGIVRNKRGEPEAGVTVELAGRVTPGVLTNQDGQFTLRGLRQGPVKLRLSREGEELKTVTIEAPSPSYVIDLE